MSDTTTGPEELSIPIGTGITIAAKAWGPPNSKQRVLALHGWLDNANSFDIIAPVLANIGIRVVCLDFIGHGRSPHKPNWCNVYYTDYITQVIDVADALCWKTFTILGHSMGAGIGSILAASMPHMVEKLICLDFIGLLSREQDQLQAIMYAMQSRERLIARKPFLYPSKESIFEKLKNNNPFIEDDAARLLLQRSIETVISPSGEQVYKLRHDPRLVGPSIFTFREHEVLVMLRGIKCPVLLIWGTVSAQQFQMKKNWTEVMEKRMKCVKNLEVINVEGSHHFHMETGIEQFTPQLLNFISTNDSLQSFNPSNESHNNNNNKTTGTLLAQHNLAENHNQLADIDIPKAKL
ncbi:alpha/beta hydrolase fold-1 domain-containing protein [Cavenderia fasciculata]|uniref:Alpha/beta hydrolase fold-1 domain-containing protein n=1 Tax=Cavenderia fasciculata TaxID=261658 RepID=F4Q1S9_CACFS|nr:alpha/beta hydrolase fold-1 domain-containing protein [Cavenderia fasciculata]EGG18229.1 alpha/beta hydrolase fold-1 domain-containing protein [Cavenderia fasciculata]|eukprot:XP_004357052.1 alpha/beta hydrolase fold-1 domain-containing protein [Cavenderia fasciculata]